MCIITKTILEALTATIKEEKEIKHTQIEKGEVELHLFTENTIIHIENPKDYKKAAKTCEFSKITTYRSVNKN